MNRGTIFIAIVILATTSACDREAKRFSEFKQQSLKQQLATRICPTTVNFDEIDSDRSLLNLKSVQFGPYELHLPKNFLQIDATRFYRAGDPIYVNGKLETKPVSHAWIEIHALAPDMVPHFLMSPKQERLRDRGELYHVGIGLFWSDDGSYIPSDGEGSDALAKSGVAPPQYVAVGAGLLQDMSFKGGYILHKFIPMDLVAGKPSTVSKIMCSQSCSVVRRISSDLWIRYGYNAENLRCWADIDARVTTLLEKYLKRQKSSDSLQ